MGATRELFPRRGVVAGVASTVVISLAALTSGLAPAVADPSSPRRPDVSSPTTGPDVSSPTTTVLETPEPKVATPQETTRAVEVPSATTQPEPKPTQTPAPAADAPVARTPVEVPSSTAAPKPVGTPPAEPSPEVIASPTTVAPKPVTTTTTDVPTPTRSTSTKATEASTPASAPTSAPVSAPAETPTATPGPRPARPGDRPTPSEAAVAEPATVAPAAQTPAQESAAPETTASVAVDATPTLTAKPSANETSSAVAKAARPIETVRPQTLDAPEADVELARNAKPVEEKPDPAPAHDIAALAVSLNVTNRNDNRIDDRDDNRDWNRPDFQRRDQGLDWDRKVRQWRPEWVQYDEYYRPMIFNPYREPVRVVYIYQNSPRIVQINPLQRVIMYAADLAAYSFTAVVVNAVNTAVNVAVGSFFGGGYIPAVGMPLPPPPPPVLRYDNVPVQVRYSSAVYQPFRVQRVVDVGDDSRYGERKVLLDGVTPAWGVWTQSGTGERQFEVHRTQQFPGLDDPREAPLPGDYRMQLVSDSAADTGLDRNQVYLIAAAVACSVLSLGAVGLVVLMGRRRGM